MNVIWSKYVQGVNTPVSYTHLDVYKRQGHVSDFQNRVQIVMDMGAGNEGQGNSFQ